MKIGTIRIPVINCIEGIYLRWWWNGYHYFCFQNGYEIQMKTDSVDIQVTRMFSIISKIERPTKLKADYSYQITLEGITPANIPGFTGLLSAEKVEQYEEGVWREVDITRGDHLIKDESAPGYILNFEISRKELPYTPAVFQKSQKLYLNDVLCDLDDDEVIPVNKQTNDIAEMQDRQSDFTAQFKIRKTRAMKFLFELSGDVGANTTFPFRNQTAKLIQDNIEMITGGKMILDKNDDQYYFTSIYSGNINFFKTIEDKKLSDLLLPSCDHTWDAATQAASNAGNLDYIYPLLEPSDDGGINPLTDDGSRTEQYGAWIWPFVKMKAIWDEIFLNAGFTPDGDILTDSRFLRMFMSISNRDTSGANLVKYKYSLEWHGRTDYVGLRRLDGSSGIVQLLNGTFYFRDWLRYIVPLTGTFKFHIAINASYDDGIVSVVSVYKGGISVVDLDIVWDSGTGGIIYEGSYNATVGDVLSFYLTDMQAVEVYDISIIDIKAEKIGYGFPITQISNYMPDMTQTDFVKMVCNMFGLVPDAIARDRKIKFWNLIDLYKNIGKARDWSAYLSEREDEGEFKFGDYARNNYLKYKDSDDVKKDTGKGNMLIDDDTLPFEKDVVNVPVSTCDQVEILISIDVSRIAFNKWNADISVYDVNDSIDPRIVYIKQITGKTFGIRDSLSGGTAYDTINPKIASSIEVSFSQLVINYAALSRMLTKTLMRHSKFNLPVYEVAGVKHDIPIYLRQYKAYFYANKINNYIPGQLCLTDLIKL